MSKLSNAIVDSARVVGQAVGTFVKARDGILRKPEFIVGLSQASAWKGGDFSNTEQAQLRAMRNSWFFAGVNKKSLDLSAAKLDIFYNPTGLEDDGKIAEGHPFLKVLRRPNPYMGKSLMFQYTDWWLELQGESFWFLEPEKGSSNGIKNIWPLPANRMDIEFADDFKSIKSYILKMDKWYYLDPNYIVHFKYPNPWDFFRGLPPLISFMLTVDADLAMKMWNGSFFGKDNVMPSAIISLGSGDPNNMFEQGDMDDVKAKLENEYSAIRRKTVVTNANSMSVALLGYNAKDMDFLSGMAWNKDEILMGLGIPAGMVDKNSTEANAKVGMKDFKDYMWAVKCMIADEITLQCLGNFYDESLEARYQDDRIYDREAELSEFDKAKEVMTEEELREKYFKLAPLAGGQVSLAAGRMQARQQQAEENDLPMKGKGNKKKNEAISNTVPSKNAVSKKAINQYRPWEEYGETETEYFKRLYLEEFEALFRKARNSFKTKGHADIKFVSSFINEETIKSILFDLSGCTTKKDIDTIYWNYEPIVKEKYIKSSFYRPWSEFEASLVDLVYNALQNTLQLLVSNASESLAEDGNTWDAILRLLQEAMGLKFQEIATKAAQDVQKMLGASNFTVSFEMTNQRAREWALLYAGNQIKDINKATRKAVRIAIDEWIANGRDNGIQGLKDRLENLKDRNGNPLFDKARAERIARSEATSVYAGATEAVLIENGYPPAVYKPRAHVNCRCYIQPGTLPNGNKVIIWYTVKDEMVCDMELETPFGTVEGCKELHRTIVSEGHAGESWNGNLWNPEDL